MQLPSDSLTQWFSIKHLIYLESYKAEFQSHMYHFLLLKIFVLFKIFSEFIGGDIG